MNAITHPPVTLLPAPAAAHLCFHHPLGAGAPDRFAGAARGWLAARPETRELAGMLFDRAAELREALPWPHSSQDSIRRAGIAPAEEATAGGAGNTAGRPINPRL